MNKIITITDTFENIYDLLEYSENTLEQNFMDKLKTSSSTPIFDVLFRNKDIHEQIYKPLKIKYETELKDIRKEINANKEVWFEHVKVWCCRFYHRYVKVEELIRNYKFSYKKSSHYHGVKGLKTDLKELNYFVEWWKVYRKSCHYIPTIHLNNTTFCGDYFSDNYEFQIFNDTHTFYHNHYQSASCFKDMVEDVMDLNDLFFKKYKTHDDFNINYNTLKYNDENTLRFNRIIMNYDYHINLYSDIQKRYKLFSNGDTSYDRNESTRVVCNKKWFYGSEEPSKYDLKIYQNWDFM